MKIIPLNLNTRTNNINFSAQNPLHIKETGANSKHIKHKTEADISKELEAIQGLNGIGLKRIPYLSMDELAKYVEYIINSGLEDELAQYHKTVLKMYDIYKTQGHDIKYTDKNGREFSTMHNFNTISVKQDYDGIPYDIKTIYIGKMPWDDDIYHQSAGIRPEIDFYTKELKNVEYNLRDFNLDDVHGNTDALISKDGKIYWINTSYDMFSPIKIKYYYKDSKLEKAYFEVFDSRTYKGKDALCIFDKNRKIQKIRYNPAVDRKPVSDETIYEKDKNGKFIKIN